MRIAFVTQWFPPEPGTVVASAIADGLAVRGHVVDVVTGFPNYPTGELQPGYPLQRYRRDERSERVTIHRAPLYPSHNTRAVKRMANYASFSASATWLTRSRLSRPDVWLTYSSPATAAVPALVAPPRLRAPSCLLIQDLWPDSVTESGFIAGRVGRSIERSLSSFCSWSYRRSTAVGVISPGMREILMQRGVDGGKIHLTPNWVDDSHLLPELVASDDLRGSLNLPLGRLFMYAGNMGELQGLEPLVRAFGSTPENHLVLVGGGVAKPQLEQLVRSSAFENVTFVDSQPTDRIAQFIAASDVQIVSLKDSHLLRATMPSKVQSSMAAGRPILAHAAGDVALVVTESGAGLSTAPGDIGSAVDTIRTLARLSDDALRAMGARSRDCFLRHFSPEAGLDRMEAMLFTTAQARTMREVAV